VIVVIGSPVGWLRDEGVVLTGTPARAAIAAAAAGSDVQVVGRTGDDPTADALLLSLTRAGVGHVALLRDPARPTPLMAEPRPEDSEAELADEDSDPIVPEPPPSSLDAGDVDLGLRYLTDYGVVVLAEPAGPEVVRVVAGAATWNAARLVMVIDPGADPVDGLPTDAIVFEAPADDADGDFAALVGRFAAALDDGTDPGDAFRSSIAAEGWTEAVGD
jgi:sugar/nucleoside kinase (ribokinase family)